MSRVPQKSRPPLQRYLAEAPWVPTALLPSTALSWTALDDRSARATLTDRGTTVSVDFHFGSQGEIIGTSTDRYRSVDGQQVLTPWIGSFSDYERVGGVMVPRRGEVSWLLPAGRHTYWRGRITGVDYQRVP